MQTIMSLATLAVGARESVIDSPCALCHHSRLSPGDIYVPWREDMRFKCRSRTWVTLIEDVS